MIEPSAQPRLTIERFAGMDRFMAEIDRRGFRAVENSGQIVIFCNRAPVRLLTGRGPLTSKESGHEIRISGSSP